MQQGIALARSEAAAQLRRGIKSRPKGLTMLAFRILHPPCVVDLAHFHLGRQAHDVAEIQDVGRQSRQNIYSILGKSLLTIKIHEIRIDRKSTRLNYSH